MTRSALPAVFKAFLRISTLLLFFIGTTFAQSSSRETVNQSIEWFAVATTIKIHQHVSIITEGQFRFVQSFDPMQFQSRTGIDFHLNKNLSVLVGYVYVWNPKYGKQPATFVNNEHRIYEQLNYKHSIGKWMLSHRLRLEQRYLQVHINQGGIIFDDGYSLDVNRARYRFYATLPLNNEKLDPKTFSFNVYDEIFASWGSPITYNKPDQNRIFIGMGYQFTKMISIQAGALYQMLIKANGTKQENNIGIQAQFNYNFDFTRKE